MTTSHTTLRAQRSAMPLSAEGPSLAELVSGISATCAQARGPLAFTFLSTVIGTGVLLVLIVVGS
jgi:hypothetical protein